MKRKIRYKDEPLGDLQVIEDFLPPPEQLAFKDETVKVTIALSKSSVEFFKREAKKAPHPVSKNDSTTYRLLCHPATRSREDVI